MKNPAYLVHHKSSWLFRIRVPLHLRKVIGKKELKYSLKTGSIGEAKYRARLIAGNIQNLFRKMERSMKSIKELDIGEIQELIQRSIRQALEDEEEMILTRKRPLPEGQHIEWIQEQEYPLYDRLEALHLGNFKIAERSLELTLEDTGIQLNDTDKESIEYKRLLKETLKSDIKALQLIIEMRKNPDLTIDRLLGTVKDKQPVQASIIQKTEPVGDSELLSVIIEAQDRL